MIIEQPHPRILLFRDVFDWSEEVIRLGEQSDRWTTSEVADYNDSQGKTLRVAKNFRSSQEIWLKDHPELVPYRHKVVDKVEKTLLPIYAAHCCPVPEGRFYDNMRLVRYKKGQHFARHIDLRNIPYGYRLFTVVTYLTENEGGDLVFPTLNIRVKPTPGMVAMFPATEQFPHASEPVLGEDPKYILTTWIYYKHKYRFSDLIRDRGYTISFPEPTEVNDDGSSLQTAVRSCV